MLGEKRKRRKEGVGREGDSSREVKKRG